MSHTSTDPIADMLTRIRNAIAVRRNTIVVPHSGVKESVANLLKQHGYIDEVAIETEANVKQLKLQIMGENHNARITEIARLSTPGRRQYVGSNKIPVVKRGRGIVIISTSQGLMSGEEARTKKVGGELICKVY